MAARYAGRETMMMAETGAMLATAILALCGAFALSVPGGSRAWLAAPLPTFLMWIGLSGAGCYDLMLRRGLGGWGAVGDGDCFLFLLAASLAVGVPVLWLLSRARPIEPLAVATLGGLGVAATAAALLQFFHPYRRDRDRSRLSPARRGDHRRRGRPAAPSRSPARMSPG